MTELSRSIRELRIKEGLTQKGLGAIIGVSRACIGTWETGTHHPRPHHLDALAAHWKTNSSALLSGEAARSANTPDVVIPVQFGGSEIPQFEVRSVQPGFSAKNHRPLLILTGVTGEMLALAADPETRAALLDCLEILRGIP